MKIRIVLFFCLMTIIKSVYAQDDYIRFTKDGSFRNNTIKYFKGEVYRYIPSLKDDKIKIVINKDTITDLDKLSGLFALVQNVKSYSKEQPNLARLKDANYISIDVTPIPNDDTVRLISYNGDILSILAEKRNIVIEKAKLGDSFRMSITNSPTLFYTTSNLLPEPGENQDSDNDGIIDKEDRCPNLYGVQSDDPEKNGCPEKSTGFFAKLKWWHYVIAFIILALAGLAIWKFLKSRMLKPDEVRFNYKSLSDFASVYGDQDKLCLLNPGLIPNKKDWNKMKNNEKEKMIHNLQGKKIKIDIEKESNIFSFQNNDKDTENLPHTEEDYTIHSEPIPWQQNEANISQLLRNLENNLTREIRNSTSKGNEYANEINRLKNEISTFKNEINTLKNENEKISTEKQKLDSSLFQLNKAKDEFTTINVLLKEENDQYKSEIDLLKDKVVIVDFLKEYCKEVNMCLNLCDDIIKQAYDYYNRIRPQDGSHSFVVGLLLLKFQSNISGLPIGNWFQTILELSDSGSTSNRLLLRSFSQLHHDSEKLREFQRLFFNEALVKYSSSIIILAEEFRNLSRFLSASELVLDAQKIFERHLKDLISKLKSLGLEPKYVPLFKNYLEFVGNSKTLDRAPSEPYRHLQELEKDSIAEIISIGFNSAFGESDTLVILV